MIARAAAAALPLALLTVATASVVLLAAWLRWAPPLLGFALFTLTVLGGGAASLLVGLLRVLTVAGAETGGRGPGLVAIGVGLACLAIIAVAIAGGGGAPPIHDITTDPSDPPAFVTAAAHPANRGRDLAYPNGSPESAALQRQAFPDLAPIVVPLQPADAYRAALAVAEGLGWRIVGSDADAGIFEAEAETSIFRFVDDVVVRVRPDGAGAVVDVRSTSRVGVGDMGVNAARIRRFGEALAAR